MDATLRKIILKKCRKTVTPESYDEAEEKIETESEETLDRLEESETIKEEPPFEDILSDMRHKYSASDEFVYLLYNDVLKYFVKEWDGTLLRKKPKKKVNDNFYDDSEEDEDIEEIESYEDTNKVTMTESSSTKCNFNEPRTSLPWKLTLPDEFANITFISNNTYSGRISRKMMEGEGVYKWTNGARYKGEFQQNRMHGKGLLEWNNDCWYEGDFVNGFRHGRGLLVDGEIRYMYTGQWHVGQRHGKGYCRYGDKGSYDGDWVMNKMSGTGLRIYPSGARYVGQWKNGLRDGKGTMVWSNGDVYRGEWKCGAMNGYGVYVWDGFLNKTLTWPQEASYRGYWRNGMRHGEGMLKINSIGGAKYFGHWKDNKKHGHGIIIGNNGERYEADPLFLNDILVTSDITNQITKDQLETEEKGKCVREEKETEPQFLERPEKLGKAPIIPILRPEQFPSLSYHLTRLLDPKSLVPRPVASDLSGKCYTCENLSCCCLTSSGLTDSVTSDEKVSEFGTDWENEECWTYDCITLHMFRLRQIYRDYAAVFAKSPPKCNLVMTRLCLWQFWRDCNINKKGLSLVEIDNYIAQNKTTFIEDPYNPFERIEIWQFLHALLEVAWHLYIKHDNIETEKINGKLAAGLHKLLKNDIYPNVGNHVGAVCCGYQDLLPIYCVFELYKEVGYPCSAKDFLRATCAVNGTQDSQFSSTTDETTERFPDGVNSVMIGDNVSYLLKVDEIFAPVHRVTDVSKKIKNYPSRDLSSFEQLGALEIVEIMTSVCPEIKDTDNRVIINMDYELTFLEFYEILLEATKRLLSLRKKIEKQTLAKAIEIEAAYLKNSLDSLPTNNRFSVRKRSKVKNKILM